MSLLFNTSSRFAIAFLIRSKHPLISWLQSSSTVILEPKKIKSVTVSIFFPYLFAMKWWDQMPWSSFFWMLSFKSAFTLSSFTFIKRLFNSLISAIRVASFAVILEPKKIKSVTLSTFSSSIYHEVMKLYAMIFIFWRLNFKPAFSLSHFHQEAL